MANAADLRVEGERAERPYYSGTSWTGFYVGAGGGGLFLDYKGDWLGNLAAPSPSALAWNKDDLGLAAGFATIEVGYDRQLTQRLVAGIFANIDFGFGEAQSTYWNNSLNFTGVGGAPKMSVDTMWTIGGRLGYLATPSTMLYALGGFSRVEFDDNWTRYATNHLKPMDGYTVGAGIETKLSGPWGLKVEYRYSGFGDQTVLSNPGCGVAADCNNKYDVSTQSARLVLNYRIGQEAYAGSYKDSPVETYIAPNWSGLSIGGGIGGVFVSQSLASTNYGYAGVDDYGAHGFLGTLQVGYDRQIASRIVAGAFADVDFTTARVNSEYYNNKAGARSDLDYSFTIGGRLGYLTSPDTMIYVLAGYTHASFDDKNFVYSSLGDLNGYTVGAGIETALTRNLFLKGEYRFSDFGENSQRYLGVIDPNFSATGNSVTTHSVRAVLSYKFNFEPQPLK